MTDFLQVSQPLPTLSNSAWHSLPLLWGFPSGLREQPWIYRESDRTYFPRHLRRYDSRYLVRPILAEELRTSRSEERWCFRTGIPFTANDTVSYGLRCMVVQAC